MKLYSTTSHDNIRPTEDHNYLNPEGMHVAYHSWSGHFLTFDHIAHPSCYYDPNFTTPLSVWLIPGTADLND